MRIFESSRGVSESFLMLGGCLQKWLKFEGVSEIISKKRVEKE
jgi:hypothetical protein